MTTLTAAISSTSSSPAITIPDSNLHISYPSLKAHISKLQSRLAALGIQPGSAVSISLPNTLEFAVSFLAVCAQGAIAAPLNSAYKQSEVEFYVDDIKAGMIIVPRGAVGRDEDAVRAARKFGAGVAEIAWEAGEVRLELVEKGRTLKPGQQVVQAKSEDIAVLAPAPCSFTWESDFLLYRGIVTDGSLCYIRVERLDGQKVCYPRKRRANCSCPVDTSQSHKDNEEYRQYL